MKKIFLKIYAQRIDKRIASINQYHIRNELINEPINQSINEFFLLTGKNLFRTEKYQKKTIRK